MTDVIRSTCENPEFPNWAWRYSRNKKLTPFDSWLTRSERWPPRYRHMGLHSNFRFHPLGPNEQAGHIQQMGANYAHDLVSNRQTGFGNAALGNPPGPAPPRLVSYDVQNPYQYDDLYKLNEIHNISAGMPALNYTSLPEPASDTSRLPLNPRQYLELTLNQRQDFPGTFPHYNAPVPTASHRRDRVCGGTKQQETYDPLKFFLQRKEDQERRHAMEERLTPRLYIPPLYLPPCTQESKSGQEDQRHVCMNLESTNRYSGIIF